MRLCQRCLQNVRLVARNIRQLDVRSPAAKARAIDVNTLEVLLPERSKCALRSRDSEFHRDVSTRSRYLGGARPCVRRKRREALLGITDVLPVVIVVRTHENSTSPVDRGIREVYHLAAREAMRRGEIDKIGRGQIGRAHV